MNLTAPTVLWFDGYLLAGTIVGVAVFMVAIRIWEWRDLAAWRAGIRAAVRKQESEKHIWDAHRPRRN